MLLVVNQSMAWLQSNCKLDTTSDNDGAENETVLSSG